MNRRDENVGPQPLENPVKNKEALNIDALEPELREALGNFKSSMTAWSEAMMSRPRALKAPARTNWQLVTKWALGSVVFAGTLSGGVYQNHRQEETAKAAAVAAARAEEQQRQLAAQKAMEQSPEDLMAKVDSDVAREVPSALEPLASLMSDDEIKGN
jgi:hypothetical protein